MRSSIAFIIGAAIGAATSYFVTKKIVQKKADEEVESVKEAFGRRYKPVRAPQQEEDPPERTDADIRRAESVRIKAENQRKVNDIIERSGYREVKGETTDYRIIDTNDPDMPQPVVIAPDEYGEDPKYSRLQYEYYEDGVITDAWGAEVDDAYEVVGRGNLEYFGADQPGHLYIRNDSIGCYIDLVAINMRHSDLVVNSGDDD